MKELDLHGLLHHQVRDEVENFVLLNAKELPIRIIIGNSIRMKNLTENILYKHNFDYILTFVISNSQFCNFALI